MAGSPRLSDFDYELPPDQIAQVPLAGRATSRLLVVDRRNDRFCEATFPSVVDSLHEGDVLVRNNTRVIPARVTGHRLPDESRFEALLFDEPSPGIWRVLAKPARKLKSGCSILLEQEVTAQVVAPIARRDAPFLPGERYVRFDPGMDVRAFLRRRGRMPLPPYIHGYGGDPERYQTTYARQEGAVAAPTAGFHFTPDLFDEIGRRGVQVVDVTLHVGPGTFQPVRVEDYTRHTMQPEQYAVDEGAAAQLARAKSEGRRIVAIGSTSLRVVETLAAHGFPVRPSVGWSDLYIYPGYRFKAVDALITNFHLPRTTLLLMVMAFGGTDLMRRAYLHAVKTGFRFYSFGDAMLIL